MGQGALGLETRSEESNVVAAVTKLNDESSCHRAMAERSMLRTLFAGCLAPVGAFTTVEGNQLTLQGIVLSRNGKQKVSATANGPLHQSIELGKAVAENLISKGADEFLRK